MKRRPEVSAEIRDLKEAIEDGRKRINVLESEQTARRVRLAEILCPFKVGDRIGRPNAPYYKGEYEVTKILPARYNAERTKDLDFCGLAIRKVRKNGSLGVRAVYLESDWEFRQIETVNGKKFTTK